MIVVIIIKISRLAYRASPFNFNFQIAAWPGAGTLKNSIGGCIARAEQKFPDQFRQERMFEGGDQAEWGYIDMMSYDRVWDTMACLDWPEVEPKVVGRAMMEGRRT